MTAEPQHRPPPSPRRHRLTSRTLPLALLAFVSLAAGVVFGARHEPAGQATARGYAAAWEHGDYGAMYALLSDASRAHVTRTAFARAYRAAARTATTTQIAAGRVRHRGDDRYTVPVRVRTRTFGTLRATLDLTVDTDPDPGVRWERRMVFPGLRPGETLRRDVAMPPRATLQTRDGQAIAEGPERTSAIGAIAADIAGRVGPIPADQAAGYAERGYPPDAMVGLTGLERQFQSRLAGRLGGTLREGRRVLASVRPQAAGPVRTSIDPDIESAAVEALAGRFGGVAVLRPSTGEVLGLAGIAYSAPQPPGSTFKIVTLSGALDAGVVKASDTFPVDTYATLSGVKLQNANGEACGGSLEQSFAESCNSVFAPIGARLGARRLVAAAERFGFNEPSDIDGAPPASIPPASEIGDDLAVGSSAIGQGRVTATPLRMATVAAAIANRGQLVRPVLLRGEQGRRSRATKAHTAKVVRRFMRAVVEGGTGAAAAIPGVRVAGKTGTAELRNTVTPDPTDPTQPPATPDDTSDTDAWFVAFAPTKHPKVAVAVLLVAQGAGGATAAPAARVVLEAALR